MVVALDFTLDELKCLPWYPGISRSARRSEGGDPGKFLNPFRWRRPWTMPWYAQNGEPECAEQCYPVRQLVPGSEGPFSVKWPR